MFTRKGFYLFLIEVFVLVFTLIAAILYSVGGSSSTIDEIKNVVNNNAQNIVNDCNDLEVLGDNRINNKYDDVTIEAYQENKTTIIYAKKFENPIRENIIKYIITNNNLEEVSTSSNIETMLIIFVLGFAIALIMLIFIGIDVIKHIKCAK